MLYRLKPTHYCSNLEIYTGFQQLANHIIQQRVVIIDGYYGINWEEVRSRLSALLPPKVRWCNTFNYKKDDTAIVQPFRNQNSLWGKLCTLDLSDFYIDKTITSETDSCLIIYGTGAALFNSSAPVIYLENSKIIIQQQLNTTEAHKRFYAIDRVVLNRHKEKIRDRIIALGNATHLSTFTWVWKKELESCLHALSQRSFRLLPWVAPGPWGGQWLKKHIDNIPQNVPNYAWDFELITTESALLLHNNNNSIEIPFEWLMFDNYIDILGKHAEKFGTYFPIRFDFLDTIEGGNLSIQCHPAAPYIYEHYNEPVPQDETYYILQCEDNSTVFLGLQEDTDLEEFKTALQDSEFTGRPVDIPKYVVQRPSEQHDLFLIPNGTVHSAGKGNLVLEISTTPYLYTLKMYDWLRPNLDGTFRPLSIQAAFENIDSTIRNEDLKSVPRLITEGEDWSITDLPTHPKHFYEIKRVEFETTFTTETHNRCLMMMLVAGTAISVNETDYYYLESFVIPAAMGKVHLTNKSRGKAIILMVMLKEASL